MKSIFVAIAATLISSTIFAEISDNQVWQYWANTKLTLDYLKAQALNEGNCSASGVNLYGCVKTLEVLLSVKGAKDGLLFTTGDWLNHLLQENMTVKNKGTYTVQKEFGPYKIVQVHFDPVPADEDDIADLVRGRQDVKDEVAYWASTLGTIKQNPLPIDDVIAYARSINGLVPENEAYKAGEGYDEYRTQAVDAHAHWEPLTLFEAEQKGDSADYTGVGMVIHQVGTKILVLNPIEDSPALAAGAFANDVIAAVNGKTTEGMSSDQVRDLLRGPENTTVNVTLKRDSKEINLTITRQKIRQPNVRLNIVSSQDAQGQTPVQVAHIRVRDFVTQNTCADTKNAILSAQAAGVQGLILDLRDNPGGDVLESVCMVGLFLGPKAVVVEQRPIVPQSGSAKPVTVTLEDSGEVSSDGFMVGTWKDYVSGVQKIVTVPSVVLISAESASAAEIVSGSLHDYQTSLIVGERSFGKASVQGGKKDSTFIDFTTIARFYMPGNQNRPRHTTQIVGVVPDIEVFKKPNPTEADKFAFREADVSPIALEKLEDNEPLSYPQVTQYYTDCMSKNGVANAEYERTKTSQLGADYQKLSALDAVMCEIKTQQQNAKPVNQMISLNH